MVGYLTDVDLKLDGLEKLLKTLKAKPPTARVGILGSQARNGDTGLTNAEVGAFHEFGTARLPQRSFLRIPISENLNKYLSRSGAFDKDTFKEVMATGSILPWLKKVAAVAEQIVAEAFDTGGFGKWPPSDMRHKTNKQTLVETQQLRNAVTSEVKE